MSQTTVGERTLEPFNFGEEYIREHFGDNVALATQQMTHSRFRQNPLPFTDHILQALALNGTESVLDLGCGNGFVLRDVVSRLRDGGQAVGFDISPRMLELAQRNVNLRSVRRCKTPFFLLAINWCLNSSSPTDFPTGSANWCGTLIFCKLARPNIVAAWPNRANNGWSSTVRTRCNAGSRKYSSTVRYSRLKYKRESHQCLIIC